MSLAPETQFGPYAIVAAIGAGGMGAVYRARDARLGRDVALKVLPADFKDDPDRLRRFHAEARALAALSHPNVVQVYGAGEWQDTPFLVMELLSGESLRVRLGKGPMSWRLAAELARAWPGVWRPPTARATCCATTRRTGNHHRPGPRAEPSSLGCLSVAGRPSDSCIILTTRH